MKIKKFKIINVNNNKFDFKSYFLFFLFLDKVLESIICEINLLKFAVT